MIEGACMRGWFEIVLCIKPNYFCLEPQGLEVKDIRALSLTYVMYFGLEGILLFFYFHVVCWPSSCLALILCFDEEGHQTTITPWLPHSDSGTEGCLYILLV